MNILAEAAALLAAVGVVQCAVGLAAVAAFAWSKASTPASRPPVTILRPLCGDEPLLEEALASCCVQNYPEYQIVFGIQNPADPALKIVERIQARFPACDITLVVDSTPHGSNRKIANLINMLPAAEHEIFVISDSDMHLARDYLERLVETLEKPDTGLVTAVYVGLPVGGAAARLGAAFMNYTFLPGVVMARLGGRQDCLGSTVMMRKDVLARIGGFAALSEHLAEDNVLGQRVCALGMSVRLAGTVPASTVPEPALKPLWHHEMRWIRTVRTVTPVALAASVLQDPIFWAAFAVILSSATYWSLAVFAVAWAARFLCARGIDGLLRPKMPPIAIRAPFWLLPLRDAMSVAEIIVSYWSDKVMWRGHAMAAGHSGPAGAHAKTPGKDRVF